MPDLSQINFPNDNNNPYNIKDASVPHSSLPAASGGSDLSLVTTGEKYTWNNAGGSNTWEGTQAQYDALPSHDPDTVYYITDGPSLNANLDDLTDVSILNPTDGDILKYSSGSWVNSAANVTQDISDQYTITKTSGNWKVNEISAVRCGNVVHMRVEMSGNGSSVSAGSNGFVGTLLGGPLPVLTIKLIGFYNSCPIMMNIEPDGALAARVTATSVTVTSSGILPLTGTFITNN